jgi:transposase
METRTLEKPERKKRVPSIPKTGVVRTAVIVTFLNRGYYQYAHDKTHQCGLLWNTLVTWVRAEWAAGRTPQEKDIVAYADSLKEFPLYSRSKQEVAKDLWAAIKTSRTNRANGMKSRAPWKEVKYRPISFSAGFGWRVTDEGKLALGFGKGQKDIVLPLPVVIDPLTGLYVPPKMWGEILLCWNCKARTWYLHVTYRTEAFGKVPQAVPDENGNYPEGTVTIAIDEGLKVAMAVACKQGDVLEILLMNGKDLSSTKRYRNKKNGYYNRCLSRLTNGSRKHKQVTRNQKRMNAKSDRRSRNANHHITAKVNTFVRYLSSDKETGELRPVRLGAGKVADLQKNTKKQHRLNRKMRQPISQWSRGEQERMLEYKTGLTLEHVDEHHTTQSCLKCTTKRKVRDRNYVCKDPDCDFKMHRDGVGSGNISSRMTAGGAHVSKDTVLVPCVDDDTKIIVTYQRAVHIWTPVQCEQHSRHDVLVGRSGKGVGKHVVEDPNRSIISEVAGSVAGDVASSTPN